MKSISFFLVVIRLFSLCISVEAQTNDKSIRIEIGQCDTLKIQGYKNNEFVWSSGNQDIVNVTNNGIICGIGEGQTYITALLKQQNKTYQFQVDAVNTKAENPSRLMKNETRASSIDSEAGNILNQIIENQGMKFTDSKLSVSENQRYLVNNKTGQPFLFISQTFWAMPRRLSREEIIRSLDICVEQGFTAIQFSAHAHYMGKNVYGDIPFKNENFLHPLITHGNNPKNDKEYDWWDHVEFIVQECVKRELTICFLPTWREQWNQKTNLNESNAFAYGKFIGKRFGIYNEWIIWVMGGDAAPDTPQKLNIHRELAKGIAFGINGKEKYDNLMMTYHTHGPTITNEFIPEDEVFMDFNTIQSGHSLKNLEGMVEESMRTQNKPTVDFEPLYDKNGQLTDEARTTIYWGVFAGGFGTSFGSWNIWHCGGRNDIAKFSIPEAFENSFGAQIKHIKLILTQHAIENRTPNQNALVNNNTNGMERILANTSADSSFIFVYSPKGELFFLNLDYLKGRRLSYKWINPGNGEVTGEETFRKKERIKEFVPPTRGESFTGNDWILVIENTKDNLKINQVSK